MILQEINLLKYCMPLVEMEDFNALIENKLFLSTRKKQNKNCMKNLSKCLETMIIQQELY